MPHAFSNVALLITHYNRSQSLSRLLNTMKALEITFGEVIVSDDCSKPEHQQHVFKLQQNFNFQLVTTPVNKGLGNNINKGQACVTKPYIFYLQEDFYPLAGFEDHVADALGFLENDYTIDIARFYAYFRYPHLKPYKKGFSEMIFNRLSINHIKFYCYSDHPHLRRTSFVEKFGPYPEGLSGDKTEYYMAIAFLKKGGKGIFYDRFTELFQQKNTLAEPSVIERVKWRQRKHPFILALRAVHVKLRVIRGHLDLLSN